MGIKLLFEDVNLRASIEKIRRVYHAQAIALVELCRGAIGTGDINNWDELVM